MHSFKRNNEGHIKVVVLIFFPMKTFWKEVLLINMDVKKRKNNNNANQNRIYCG